MFGARMECSVRVAPALTWEAICGSSGHPSSKSLISRNKCELRIPPPLRGQIRLFNYTTPATEDIMGSTATAEPETWIRASEVYNVSRTTLNGPANRKLRVITIGAGVSGVN